MPALPEQAVEEARQRRRDSDRPSADPLDSVRAAVEDIDDDATRRAFERLLEATDAGESGDDSTGQR